MKENILLILGPSHYCEKARWAMDYIGFPYIEEAHIPLFHIFAVKKYGGKRSLPVLITKDGKVFSDSTDILHFLNAYSSNRLYPENQELRVETDKLEDYFDTVLGPHTRRAVYYHIIDNQAITGKALADGVPDYEKTFLELFYPLITFLMKKSMRIDSKGAKISLEKVDEVFKFVSEKLSDGRKFLLGDIFSAADISFASLAAPVLMPEKYTRGLISLNDFSPDLISIVNNYREQKAGRFALYLYDKFR